MLLKEQGCACLVVNFFDWKRKWEKFNTGNNIKINNYNNIILIIINNYLSH